MSAENELNYDAKTPLRPMTLPPQLNMPHSSNISATLANSVGFLTSYIVTTRVMRRDGKGYETGRAGCRPYTVRHDRILYRLQFMQQPGGQSS